ncbi:GntR family transcriptional regulator [Mesorhizobium sp. M1233]|uniref:GntR family transcriptional regulator n=1 Tax=Mesorhizobium sp. M1233 TaxID=2957072 RepID=UPI00333A77FF
MIGIDTEETNPPDGPSMGRVLVEVRKRLITGEYSPGDKMKLRWLAEDLGTSVTPVREALMQLVAAGALINNHQRSICVPPADWKTYKEIRDLRVHLEGGLVAYAAARITHSEIADLEEIATLLEATSQIDSAKRKSLIADFHFGIYRAADKPVTLQIVEGLWLQSGPYLNFLIPDYLPYSSGPRLRASIIRALRARDAMSAAEALQTDLRDSLGFVLKKLEGAGAHTVLTVQAA